MDTIFEEQPSWNDFINNAGAGYNTYATCNGGPTQMSSLDCFCHGAFTTSIGGASLSEGPQAEHRIASPACIDRTCQQQLPRAEDVGINVEEKTSELEEIKALLEENSRRLEENSRQTEQIWRYLADLSPYLQGMRSLLKALTEKVDRQWEVKTPVTPYFRTQDTSSDVANEAARHGSRSAEGGWNVG